MARKRVVVGGIIKWIGEPTTVEEFRIKPKRIKRRKGDPVPPPEKKKIDLMLEYILSIEVPFSAGCITEAFGTSTSSYARYICKYLEENGALTETPREYTLGPGRKRNFFDPNVVRELHSKDLFTKQLVLEKALTYNREVNKKKRAEKNANNS